MCDLDLLVHFYDLDLFALQVLLDLARIIFEEQSNVASLIQKIMMHTQSLLQCERCQVLLVDESSKVSILVINQVASRILNILP